MKIQLKKKEIEKKLEGNKKLKIKRKEKKGYKKN